MVVLPQLAPPGLSPRVRGEELILGPRALLRGIIPAGAGRRGRVDDLQSGVEDHPRGGAFRGLADTGKGTVAKQMWGIVRQYVVLCQILPQILDGYWGEWGI